MALSSSTQLTAYRGFDASFVFDLADALPSGTDLIGKSALFSLKQNRLAPDTDLALHQDFVIDSSHLDPDVATTLIIAFSAAAMQGVAENLYFFDLKIFDDTGKGVLYVPHQEVQIIDDVTDRIVIS